MLEATQQERRYDPTKVAKCLSLSSRGWGDFCANHKYDTTQGENECAHIQRGSSVQARWLPPLANRVLGLQPALSVMLMMDSEASLFRTGFVCRRWLKEKNKRTGSDGPLPCSFFGNNGRRCPFFLSQLIGRTCCLIALQLADQTHLWNKNEKVWRERG